MRNMASLKGKQFNMFGLVLEIMTSYICVFTAVFM